MAAEVGGAQRGYVDRGEGLGVLGAVEYETDPVVEFLPYFRPTYLKTKYRNRKVLTNPTNVVQRFRTTDITPTSSPRLRAQKNKEVHIVQI